MFTTWTTLKPVLKTVDKNRICLKHLRTITALYITGDKAKENYATLQPFMDYEKIQREREELEFSIAKRNLKEQINLDEITKKYEVYKKQKAEIEHLEKQRENVAQNIKDVSKKTDTSPSKIEALKAQGKKLREHQKTLREAFYPIEDEFAHAYLNIPNTLHDNCGIDDKEKLIFRNGLPLDKTGCKSHLEHTNLLHFINKDRYYMFGKAAKFDIYATQALTRHFVNVGKFLQTSNPDFVRCVLLEANATPLENYHKVIEQHLQNQLNCAYLTGGASFESYLANVTRLSVFPNVLPLRYVCCGRSYEKSNSLSTINSNLFVATQTNAVQTFVATETAQEADEQFENILNLAIDFYKSLGLHFRIVYEDAGVLTASESLRASIEVFSPAEHRYVCVGRVSNYGDYVSKRILFCLRRQKEYKFLHLVGGPVLYTSRLIAAMIENGLELDHEQLLGAYVPLETEKVNTAINEFKDVFK